MNLSPAVQDIYPFSGRFINTQKGRIHVLDEGEGRPLVMIHGNPTWSFFYRNLILALRSTHRCIAPDHLGCGLSDKPAGGEYDLASHVDNLDRVLSDLGVEEFDLVVHDWGGPIGIGAALLRIQNLRRIVVMNTAAFRSSRIPFRINVCRFPVFGPLAVRGLNAFSRAALDMAVVYPLKPEVKAGYLAPYDSWANRIAIQRFVEDIPMSAKHRSYPALVAIEEGLVNLDDKPMKILWGGQDFCFNKSFYDTWIQRFPQAEARYFEGAGHYLLEDATDPVIEEIRKFLA